MFFNKVKIVVVGLVVASSFGFSAAHAAEYRVLCDKVKSCLVENMKAQGAYYNGIEVIMDSVLEQTCEQGLTQYRLIEEKSKTDATLKVKSDACLESILSVNCSKMINDYQKGESVTPECKDAEAYANEKGYLDDSGQMKQ